ncbi:MAG: hypothetical protein R2932_45980 [Caldilineaceae bacterium]
MSGSVAVAEENERGIGDWRHAAGARSGTLFDVVGIGDLFQRDHGQFFAAGQSAQYLGAGLNLGGGTGITFVLLCGEIDLGVAAVAMMTGVVAAAALSAMAAWPSGFTSAVIDLCRRDFCRDRRRVKSRISCSMADNDAIGLPSFMATLATMQIATGLGQFFTKGQIVYTPAPLLSFLGGECG